MSMNGSKARRVLMPSVVLAGVAGVCLAPAALAGLGETAASVQRDHTALRGTALTVTPMASYDLHEITTADNSVREYVSHAGNVFAVTWSGRARPDLSVVLGARYAEFTKSATSHPASHKVFALTTNDLVMHVQKLPRGIVGEAHAPSLFPAGVSAQDIR
jgi:hypothetical protein